MLILSYFIHQNTKPNTMYTSTVDQSVQHSQSTDHTGKYKAYYGTVQSSGTKWHKLWLCIIHNFFFS